VGDRLQKLLTYMGLGTSVDETASYGEDRSKGSPANLRAVLLDTQGPEIRTGGLAGDEGKLKITLTKGDTITLTTDEACNGKGDTETIYVTYQALPSTVAIGSTILLDDGAVGLTVSSIDLTAGTVLCHIDNTGLLGSRKGVNLPGAKIDLPPMTEKDIQDLKYGVSRDVDFVAASFVRKADDVLAIRKLLHDETEKLYGPLHRAPLIISKIENGEGIENFDEILTASDGIMVARGDLGVEIPVETVFAAQKEMIHKCRSVGKPVVVATQMLESMIKNPRPTRAEVSDVANAVCDGADCVMLSGECANGDYPVEAVTVMNNTLLQADKFLGDHRERMPEGADVVVHIPKGASDQEVLAKAAVDIASAFETPLIIVLSKSGNTARMIAKYRPSVPVMAFMTDPKVGRQLQIHRGLFPVCISEDANVDKYQEPSEAIQAAKALGWCKPGDNVVLLAGVAESNALKNTTSVSVATVK